MAKILVPETGSQLSLSFEGKANRTVAESIPNVGLELSKQVFIKTHERLAEVFKPVNFTMIAAALKAANKKEVCFVGRKHQQVKVTQIITEICEGPFSYATVALGINLRGPSGDFNEVYNELLRRMEVSLPLLQTMVVRDGRLMVTTPVDHVTKVKVGSMTAPPTFDSFVLLDELLPVCQQLEARNRPYHIVAAA
ncbi:MAG: hypothetical protein KBD16_04595 [Candidatus Pacebacteria bacterium]|nr:hypothetical protein [Candidatus Paceibacterota bacterium]